MPAQSFELCAPGTERIYGQDQHDQRRLPEHNARPKNPHVQYQPRDVPSSTSISSTSGDAPLGKPTAQHGIHVLDVAALCLSVTCLALAITAVASERISWRLGVGNYQLVVLGFLLSIMNLCLARVAPNLFLILEARYGESTLQNYDGILRNEMFSSKLSMAWRIVLALMLALPLDLSAAYKSFGGGQSTMDIRNATKYFDAEPYYGMFAPPGVQDLGAGTGISLFFNATLPFAVASSSELLLPKDQTPYGFNILMISNESTAVLDVPQPEFITAAQNTFEYGESWNVTATVIATVARLNHSKTDDPEAWHSYFMEICEAGEASSGVYTHMSMMNDKSLVLLNRASLSDQSLQYIGFPADPGIQYNVACSAFAHYAKTFYVDRQLCKATWTITRGSVELVDANCDGTLVSSERQLVVTWNTLFPGVWYMSSLVEFMGPFATTRDQSEWKIPYMATGVAAMLWSRITVLNSAAGLHSHYNRSMLEHTIYTDKTYESVGLVYPAKDAFTYMRPTLRKSVLLYLVFAIQPLLAIVATIMTMMLRSTPLDKGFGLVSILAGIERSSLDTLGGAALSGELTRAVKLNMRPFHDDRKGSIEYQVTRLTHPARNGKLNRGIVYH